MNGRWLMPLIALGAGSLLADIARAGGRDPLVIPGIGPESAGRQPVYAQTPARAPMRQVASSGLGGGLIEFLVTGRDGSGRPAAAAPLMHPVAMQPAQAASNDYGAQREQLLSVQRGLDPAFARAEVPYQGHHAPGTLIVDTPSRYLYLVVAGGRAIRYGIGVGRPGFEWAGEKRVTRKAEWPAWTPPPEMLKRRPDLPKHMEGGPANPLGARALYLGSSLYRIHGTNEPETIGRNVSSGCIRMMNEDVVDLYERVPVGAKVIVI